MGEGTLVGRQVWPQEGSRMADGPSSIERISLDQE